MSTPG
jgi:hypothetical protein